MARWLCIAAFVTTALACGETADQRPPDGRDPSAGTGSGGNGGGAANGGAGNSGPLPTETCGTSKVGSPMLRRLTSFELTRSLDAIFPEVKGRWTSALSGDSVSHHGFDNEAAGLLVSKQTAAEIAETAQGLATAVTGDALPQILPCAGTVWTRACAGEFLGKHGKRLFRRPLTDAESGRYLDFYEAAVAKTDSRRGLAWMIRALVESPHFIYRREIGVTGAGGRQLSQHEIATELAYTYTGTTPSDALLAQADRNELTTAEQLQTVAKTLLASSGHDVVDRFFTLWLGYGRVTSLTKANVPDFAARSPHMAEETRRFIQEVVFARSGGVRELLTANFTTPTPELSTFYGFPAPASAYAVVARPPERGIGVLAQGSVLATRAQPTGSSPTQRGVLVYERLLCREKPIVPANVPILPAPQPGQLTTRQRYEQQHASVQPCKGCHQAFDPIGFGFEWFDSAGRWRANDDGLPIDSASHVPSKASTEPLFTFTTQEELATGLANAQEVHACVSGYVTTYAFGAPEACLGESRRVEFMTGSIGFLDYLASLAAEPHFTRRAQ